MPGGPHIRLLSEAVINKIAAGEVVERPASVLKELVENSLDAGATRVDVEIIAGGRKLIAVSDNGSGMDRDDALLSIERHATSKIRDIEDIERISTLGFRGEALAAIAAVSRMTLTTRTADNEIGTELVVAGGVLQEVRETGCPPGTRVVVRHLFYNVPARRKFLRSEQTELAFARHTFLLYALSHPEVAWSLRVDEGEPWRLPPTSVLLDRIRDLFDDELTDRLRPLEWELGPLHITGFAGVPAIARGDRTEQYIFVNGRPATAPLLHHAISEGYHTLLPPGRHPVLFLFLNLPSEQVDVNVHPTKREVRFRQPGAVRDAVIAALRAALGAPMATEVITRPAPQPAPPLVETSFPWIEARPPGQAPASPAAQLPTSTEPVPRAPWRWFRILGQVGGLYVVLETDEGLVLMDPHAAHERVLFERLLDQMRKRQVRAQSLLVPEAVTLRPLDAQRIRNALDDLRKLGFSISEFGQDTFIVDGIPSCLGAVAAAPLLTEIASALENIGPRGGTERLSEETIAQAACKAAVKARDPLQPQEIQDLVQALAATEMPYTCPHGRPTLMFLSFKDLHRKFGRA